MNGRNWLRYGAFVAMVITCAAGLVSADQKFQWKGEVDGTDEIEIRGSSVRVKHLEAQPIQSQDHRFSEPLPRAEVRLKLRKIKGRGDVDLMQQPSSRNNYTAVVRIEDDKGGSDDYEFELSWEDDWEDDDWGDDEEDDDSWGSGFSDDDEGSFRWRGRVDVGAEIEIRGSDHRVNDQGGSGTQERQARFNGSLPSDQTIISLHKVHGRGLVLITQFPNKGNNYTAKVKITDNKGGADDYEFELTWK